MLALTPSHIMQTAFGFFAAKTLLSAVEFKLFTHLGDGSLSGGEIGAALALHPRAIPDFPDALVALGLLARDGDGADARYRNTPETAAFLDQTKPGYMGGILDMANNRLYPHWGSLSAGLKTGEAQNEAQQTGNQLFDTLYDDPAQVEEFTAAMAALTRSDAPILAETFNFSRYETLVDIGGASGQLAISLAQRHPHMTFVTCDLAAVEPVAKRAIAAAGLSDRISARTLDFFREPFPKANVITMSRILHDWNLEKKMQLLHAAYAALPTGGALIAIENLIDDARRSHAFGLLMSLNMLIECSDGFDYSGADFAGWCREVGFTRTEVLPLTEVTSAAIAYK